MTFYIRVQHLNDEGLKDLFDSIIAEKEKIPKLIDYVKSNRQSCNPIRATPRSILSLSRKMEAEVLKKEKLANKKLLAQQKLEAKRLEDEKLKKIPEFIESGVQILKKKDRETKRRKKKIHNTCTPPTTKKKVESSEEDMTLLSDSETSFDEDKFEKLVDEVVSN